MPKREFTESGNSRRKSRRTVLRNRGKDVGVESVSVGRGIAIYTELPNFNTDFIPDILSFLPAESLLRFKCVCKKWISLIQEEGFINKHSSRGGSTFHANRNAITEEEFYCIASILGLLLEQCPGTKKCRIRNPTTHQVYYLPDPPNDNGIFSLGFSHSEHLFKVIWILDKEDGTTECAILTLRSKEPSWRTLSFPNSWFVNTCEGETLILDVGGPVHYTRLGIESSQYFEIISLDVEDESFSFTTLPKSAFVKDKVIWKMKWKNCLTFANIVVDKLDMFVLEDYKKQKWNRQEIPLTFLKEDPDALDELDVIVGDDGFLYFWLDDCTRIIHYSTEDEKVVNNKALPQPDEDWYSFQKTLVSFEGMQPET